MRTIHRLARLTLPIALLLLAAGLAGCVGGDGDEPEPGQGGDDASNESQAASRLGMDLFGWVVDASFDPVASVNLTVVGAPVNATSDEQGFYAFELLPRQENLVIIAQHERFETQSKRVLLPDEGSIRLNYTLEPRPTKTAYHEVLDFEGLLACQAVVVQDEGHLAQREAAHLFAGMGLAGHPMEPASADEDRYKVDCGTADSNNADQWEFSIGRDVQGVVVEVNWEAETDLSQHFRLTLETAGHGGDDAILAQVIGPNVLLAQVNNHQANRYYGDGGIVRATVEVDPNVHDQETGVGAALAYQQDFTIHASVFYHEGPSATYSYHAS